MKKLSLIVLLTLSTVMAWANNVNISNVSIINGGANNVKVKFDISWDNSWRVNTGQNNYDGAWVFFKYRRKGTQDWLPLFLTGTGNSSSPNYSIYQGPIYNSTLFGGAIIYRTTNGFGSVSFTNVQLSVYSLAYEVDIKAFAVEMVYIPGVDAMYFGDGDDINESTNAFHNNSADNHACIDVYANGLVNLLTIQTDANSFDDDYLNWENGKQLYIADSGFSYSSSPASRTKEWPVMSACWCMKYEISQAAYRDFLNTLTVQQQTGRTAAPTTAARGTVALVTSGSPVKAFIKIDLPSSGTTPAVYGCDADGDGNFNQPNDGEWEACGYLSYPDVAAYLAWSGLAPMTELLFEKICRGFTDNGSNNPSYKEYAWGTNQIVTTRLTLSNPNLTNETVSNMAASAAAGYANYITTSPNTVYATGAPLRNGIFAAFPGGDRITSGASFFGVMEMSGNLQEVCITIGNNMGRGFKARNGYGQVTATGNARGNLSWPGTSNNPADDICVGCDVMFGAGTIMRGGDFTSGESFLRIADRSQGAGSEVRMANRGGRGVLY